MKTKPLGTDALITAVGVALTCLHRGRIEDAEAVLLELNFALEQDHALEMLAAAEAARQPFELH